MEGFKFVPILILSKNKINNYGQFLDKYSLQKVKMEFVQQLVDFVKPKPVSCNNDLETHLETMYF